MGDGRTYDQTIGLRAVTSRDGMTADWFPFPPDVLALISNRIANEVAGVNRVVYDVSSKPPATIGMGVTARESRGHRREVRRRSPQSTSEGGSSKRSPLSRGRPPYAPRSSSSWKNSSAVLSAANRSGTSGALANCARRPRTGR